MIKKNQHFDYIFMSCVIVLAAFGLIMLSSASSDLGKIKFNDTYYYLKHQAYFGLIPGVIGFIIASVFYHQRLKKIAVPFLIFNVVLLILIFTPLGFSHKGASRWLDIGPFSFQPAEFLKLSFIIYISAWLSNKKSHRHASFLKGFLPFLIVSGLIAALVFSQPATTILLIIMGAALTVYFISGAKLSYFFGVIFVGIAILSLVVYFTPYRYKRISAFFSNSVEKELTSRYQVNQAQMAIENGGMFGIGFGKSTIKYKNLPEPIGDSIFAVIAEEFGFVGAMFLIGVFIILFAKGFAIARRTSDQFSRLMVVGFISIIALQTFIHIAAVSGLIPLTGVPLPFVSFGGTALAVFLTMSGIIVNISKYT